MRVIVHTFWTKVLVVILAFGLTIDLKAQDYLEFVDKNSISFAEHVELGYVHWIRDYDKAMELSARMDRPVFLLFQEVPGCATCVNYGKQSLSHPLMVEAIENDFIPVAIFNNKGGKDREILKKYNEPSWNNPVVRFVDAQGKDITSKVANDFHPQGLHAAMTRVYATLGEKPPKYFELVAGDLKLQYSYTKEMTFKTACFWSGESRLAQIDGVLQTEAGWNADGEVVHITYDPRKTEEKALAESAKKHGYTTSRSNEYRLDKDPQYYLKNSKYRYLPLSVAQRTAINSALGSGQELDTYLSPKQLVLLQNITDESDPQMYRKDITKLWDFRASW